MAEGRKDDVSSDRVDIQSIGSISSLRSRFENASVTASNNNKPTQPNPLGRSKPSAIGSSITPSSAPILVTPSPVPIPTPPTRPKTPEPLLVPEITEQPPSPAPSPFVEGTSAAKEATSSYRNEIKKKPPPPVPASIASRNRRRSTDTVDDRSEGLFGITHVSPSIESLPASAVSALADNGNEEATELASSPEQIQSVSALRNKFNQAPLVATSSRGPSRPASPQPVQASSSGLTVVKPKPVPPPPRSQARPLIELSGVARDDLGSKSAALENRAADPSYGSIKMKGTNLGPPPPPPLHSRPRTDAPDVVHERSTTSSSAESEIGSLDSLAPRAHEEAVSSEYSRSPEPMSLRIPSGGHGPALSPPLPIELTASPNRTPRIASLPIPEGSSSSEGLLAPDSQSNPPVLPPRQSSGQHQVPSMMSSSAPPAAPALPPRASGTSTPTGSNAAPTLPDRDRGLSRSASVAVGRSAGQMGQEHGHGGRETLKRMVKRSNTLLHRPAHLHRRREAGEEDHDHLDRTEELIQDAREYVPPPPPMRSQASGTATAAAVVPRTTRSYDSEEDQIDEDELEGGDGKPDTLDEIAHTTTYSGSKTLANSKLSANRALAEYPDSTRVNRRAPDFVPRQRLTAATQLHCFAVSGHKLCTAGSSVKVYDMTLGDSRPIFVSEPKALGLETKGKDTKVTAMSFRSPGLSEHEGRFLWCGTNGGHLWELDILTGEVTDTKLALHASSITHLFRHDDWMVSLDELGKVNVFGPFTTDHETSKRQTNAPCRTLRTADRQNFAAMLGGQLWTASGPAARSTTNSALRGPTLRIYDPAGTTSGNTAGNTAGKTTFTSEWTGAVTAATVDPFDNQSVYLAHEGGYISKFDRSTLVCQSVLKISPTDILGLEYVGDYLWAGNRSGVVNVYDTRTTPWTTINTWLAHPDNPIMKIYADPYSIDQAGKYCVWTWARDALHAWDGLLSVDWIETAMQDREDEYCRFRDLSILISSWNIDSAKPSDLTGSPENQGFLQECLTSVDSPDIIIFGWQEVIDLNNKKLTAKTMLFGSKSKQDGRGNTDSVSRAYRDWQDKLQLAVRMYSPSESGYTMLDAESMVGLMTVVFVKSSLKGSLRDVAVTTIKRGIGGVYGNKGAVVARLTIDDSSICFINVHLAAGQSHKVARNADVAGILEEKAVFSTADTEKGYVNGGDGSAILDHETVFLNGDLNYRIDQRRDNVISSVNAGDLNYLLEHDQLRKEMIGNTSFRLRAFHEAPITFAPTYKYTPNSVEYDQSEKKRIPAWCDRILWKSRKDERVECLNYRRYEPTLSDHRPISAAFKLTAKSIDPSRYTHVRDEVEKEWFQKEGDLMQRIVDAFEDFK